MSNNYYVVKDNLIDALEHIEKFEEKMEIFTDKHPGTVYSIKIDKLEDKWEVNIYIRTKDERENYQTS